MDGYSNTCFHLFVYLFALGKHFEYTWRIAHSTLTTLNVYSTRYLVVLEDYLRVHQI